MGEDEYLVSPTNLTFIDLYTDPLGWRGSTSTKLQDIWTVLANLQCEGMEYGVVANFCRRGVGN